MKSKYNKEQIVILANTEHDNLYQYTKVNYKNLNTKVEITCRKHGSFWQTMDKHVTRGQGCPNCAVEEGRLHLLHTQEDFIKLSKEAQVVSYDYSKSVYKGNKKKVIIGCPVHGDFEQVAAHHMQGHGCTKCANEANAVNSRDTTPDFIFKAILAKGEEYDYSKVVYVDTTTKVEIVCKEHGSFWQSPNNHLQRAGCPKCGKSGYNRNLPGTFYILKDADITKVGITNVPTDKRLGQINTRSKRDFSVVHTQYFKSGVDALNLETSVLRYLRQLYKNPTNSFEGSTECFFDVNLKELLEVVSPLATQPEIEQSIQQ